MGSRKAFIALAASCGAALFFNYHTSRPTYAASAPSSSTPSIPPSEIMRYGFPSNDNVRYRSGYVLSYNNKHKTANWVCELLTKEKSENNADRKKCEFVPDESIHPFFRSLNSDYKASGFDRGHLANAANQRWSQTAMNDTFFLSNMSPQVGKGFNRDIWNRLEMWVRSLLDEYARVTVCTGPLFLPHAESDGKMYIKYEVIGSSQVAVPTHFFKVVMGESVGKNPEIMCFIMPNAPIPDTTPVSQFLVPLEAVEKAAGFLLFERLDQARYSFVKRDNNGRLWLAGKPK